MTFVIPFPAIDPVLVEIGPFAIRWYALAYIAGLILGWRYCRRLAARPGSQLAPEAFDDFLLWATLGVVLGGRLGYVFFYKPGHFLMNPQEILLIWQGGMSFHGGLIGVLVTIGLFARKQGVHYFTLADIVACATPIGLFFGRIANFINGELFGRASDVPWAMVFPHGGPAPRHPSQLYEAVLEGLVLFLVLLALSRRGWLERPGALSGVFLIGYGLARILVEFFREPDAHLGFLFGPVTMGQLLSLPLAVVGLLILLWARGLRRP
ncbi:MAG: prolipoprotein diacylglyceryl transferase [Kiloniellales bacterium]|nr:prolipoprotein diacylglyceryl transferase [Kiloniellales bacterium]